MRFGFCTGFASEPLFSINLPILENIRQAGFDFAELPLMSVCALSDEEADQVLFTLSKNGLASDSACNLFPSSVRLFGTESSNKTIEDYLDRAFLWATKLGTKKLIFGSAGARWVPEETTAQEAKTRFLEVLSLINAKCTQTGIPVLLEPIKRGEANFINTLEEGAQMVKEASLANIALMADLFHMMSNGESLSDLERNLPLIQHVHICEEGRALANGTFSPYITKGLSILKANGYKGTISYESSWNGNQEDLKKSLAMLRDFFN